MICIILPMHTQMDGTHQVLLILQHRSVFYLYFSYIDVAA